MLTFLQAIGQDCWQSSELMTVASGNFPSALVESHPALATYALLFCLLYFLIFVENAFISISISYRALFNSLALDDTLANKNLTYAINNSALLCLPVLALALYFMNVTRLNFIFILALVAAYSLLHIALFLLAGWLKRCPELMRTLSVCERIYLIVFTTLALLLLLAFKIAGGLSIKVCATALATVLILLFILLSVRSLKIFKENNASILFWFFYLCTLEVLPLGLLICALIRL